MHSKARKPRGQKKSTTEVANDGLKLLDDLLGKQINTNQQRAETQKTVKDVIGKQKMIAHQVKDMEELLPILRVKIQEMGQLEQAATELKDLLIHATKEGLKEKERRDEEERQHQKQLETLQLQLQVLQLDQEAQKNLQRQERLEQQRRYPTKEERKYDEKIKEGDDDSSNACVICFENRRVCVIRPCKHFSLCISCATVELDECPQCRRVITCIERQFL